MGNVLAFIAKLADLANLAITVYQDVAPFIAKIKMAATTPSWQPTQADWDELDATEAPLNQIIADQDTGV